jgi:hypothetical protein
MIYIITTIAILHSSPYSHLTKFRPTAIQHAISLRQNTSYASISQSHCISSPTTAHLVVQRKAKNGNTKLMAEAF